MTLAPTQETSEYEQFLKGSVSPWLLKPENRAMLEKYGILQEVENREEQKRANREQFKRENEPFYRKYFEVHQKDKKTDDYSLLGLRATETYTRKDVQKAFRRKAQKWHPDHGGSKNLFQKLNAAYQRILLSYQQ